ncbi:MAG: hypothetical protein D6761_08025 [Candidatus Dadabacteria bacterium]|nr:MAG: hypothetical protein D6761_08025 [Candidatus Dadabacteria bacterium]
MRGFNFSSLIIAVIVVWTVVRHFVQARRQWRRLIAAWGKARSSTAAGRHVGGGLIAVDDAVLGPWFLFVVTPRGLRVQGRGPLQAMFAPVLVPWSRMEVRRYVRLPFGRGYEVLADPERTPGEPLHLFLPDRVVRAARVFLEIPESEQPDR